MNKYYIILIIFSVVYLVIDIAEYFILKKVKNVDFKNYFDYKLNYKNKINKQEHLTNSNADDDDEL